LAEVAAMSPLFFIPRCIRRGCCGSGSAAEEASYRQHRNSDSSILRGLLEAVLQWLYAVSTICHL